MIGELINTGMTFGAGRQAINTAFSGTATLSNASISGNFSAGTGGAIYSGGTNLYNIFVTTADGNDITRVQPGLNIYTGGTGNNPTINLSAATLAYLSATSISASTIYSGSTPLQNILNVFSAGTLWSSSIGSNSIITNNGTGNQATGNTSFAFGSGNLVGGIFGCMAIGQDHIVAGLNNLAIGGNTNIVDDAYTSAIVAGTDNIIQDAGTDNVILGGGGNLLAGGISVAIIGGTNNTAMTVSDSVIIGGLSNAIFGDSSSIISSSASTISIDAEGIVILGMSGYSAVSNYTTYTNNMYIDNILDLKPMLSLPMAKIGRIFFSGSPLNRLMQNTGGTSASWCVI